MLDKRGIIIRAPRSIRSSRTIRSRWHAARTTLRLTVAALLGALLLPSVSPTSAAADTAPISTGAVFNNPKGSTTEKNAVKSHIINAINNTQSGRMIRAALYALKDQDYTSALISAHRRGVTVRVVLDSKFKSSSATQSLISALGTNKFSGSWVHVCTDGAACIATGRSSMINHNKFFTFSRVGDAGVAEDVVIQTSANQTSLNTEKYWNNAYTVVGNTALYYAYRTYFKDLAAMVKDDDYFTSGKVGTEKYYFFPQKSGDIVVGVLNNVSCAGGSTVRVATLALHRDEVALKLRSLADQGCSVRIVFNESNDVDKLSGHRNIALRQLRTADGYLVHSKYLLIEGDYAGHPGTKWTFTGSHNLDYSSLRDNDEAMLRLEGEAPHDAYRENFESMFALASPVS
ncbi:phospholipase D-like domain-containing protein [Streptomyces gobiensis]|uniref:phospholipase D-like domain-containing protein n=1 Tax=Streptomyces gobiensis TaxID=2875706 RepID=UPI001E4BF516|nr:phospholipase D-like domain-containing protein [Streptomyces gobiensis]UGY94228.1 phospholipase D-like domain-containing protein [Streptomyces gobiensis]